MRPHLECYVHIWDSQHNKDGNLLQQVQRAVKITGAGVPLLQIQAEIADLQAGKEKASERFHYSLPFTIRGLIGRREREGLFIQTDSEGQGAMVLT